jgi:hypothetical protein
VIVPVIVIGPVIVAVHVHGNDTVIVIGTGGSRSRASRALADTSNEMITGDSTLAPDPEPRSPPGIRLRRPIDNGSDHAHGGVPVHVHGHDHGSDHDHGTL